MVSPSSNRKLFGNCLRASSISVAVRSKPSVGSAFCL